MDSMIKLISTNHPPSGSGESRLDTLDTIERKLHQASDLSGVLHELAVARQNGDQGALSVLNDLLDEVRTLFRQVN